MQLKTIWVIIHKHTHAGSAFLILKPFSQTHGPSSIAPTQLSAPTATQGSRRQGQDAARAKLEDNPGPTGTEGTLPNPAPSCDPFKPGQQGVPQY